MKTSTAVHEAAHVVALHHYFGPIIHSVKTEDDGSATTWFHCPLKTGTNHLGAFEVAVSTMAGIVAEHLILGLPAAFGWHHADGQTVEECWQHYQKHNPAPRVYQLGHAAFLRAVKTAAHALVADKAADIVTLAKTFEADADAPDIYLHPTTVELRRMHLLGELFAHAKRLAA